MKRISCSWIRRLNIVNMAVLPKLICRFSAVHIRIPTGIFVEIDKWILKLIWKCKVPRIAKTILKKKKKVG